MAEIYNETPNTIISGTNFDDSIQNHGANVTISGNYGNNEISNYGNKVSINGGLATILSSIMAQKSL